MPHLTSTHPPAAAMMLCIPFLFLFPALGTSDKRYWAISGKRRMRPVLGLPDSYR
jgi:hypothetical protein